MFGCSPLGKKDDCETGLLQPLNFYNGFISGSIAHCLLTFPQYQLAIDVPLQARRLARLRRIFVSWYFRNLESRTDVSSTSGDIHNWKIQLFICILNIHATFNQQKSHRSIIFAPDTNSNENTQVILTSSIHEPLDITTSCWPIILALFLRML